MSVVSLKFLLFCIATFVIYYIVPKKLQWVVLLIASLGFYCYAGPVYVAYILGASFITYLAGRKIGKVKEKQKEDLKLFENASEKKVYREKTNKRMRLFLVLGIVFMVLQLVYLKYTGFIVENIAKITGEIIPVGNIIEPLARLMNSVRPTESALQLIEAKDVIAPLGCSYYTFTMISYLCDIYRGKIKHQNNYLKYLLFVSYFPQITQGPIPRYGELSDQFFRGNKFSYDGVRDGLLRVIYGVFKKIVIAEPIGVFVTTVYGSYQEKSGLVLFLAALLYSVQIYADFSGYTDIVSGVSETMGIKLGKNFERPFFARTIPEFWRRWHISLSSWFREYVFYALSSSKGLLKLNRNARKLFGNTVGRVVSISIPVLSVWLLTGFWHGASWNMILWGAFHGVLIMFSIIFEPTIEKLNEKLKIKTKSFSWALFQMGRTTLLCTFGRIISWNTSLAASFGIIKRIFVGGISMSNFGENGLSGFQFMVLAVAILVMLAISLIQEYHGPFREWFAKQGWWFRWPAIFLMLAVIFMFGTYGINAEITFAYEQF